MLFTFLLALGSYFLASIIVTLVYGRFMRRVRDAVGQNLRHREDAKRKPFFRVHLRKSS